ncbi:hypothetical protein [Pseudomonas sp. GXZC]|uniref:hypothetical protein n=1 Tax=Pseudomonas sp. GXZC TaxID=3003351 RepID=UPI0022AB2481|nr:hypothetical protein [Pseudomonas sp. GXZC]WAT32189.1 hypothetical protein OZ428_33455 [Pseudomonas sp. GXZC]
MSELDFASILRTNELIGSITQYASAVHSDMNVTWYEKMLEAFETELFDRGYRFCHKSADDELYKVHLKIATKMELGELVMLARARHVSPTQSVSEIRERISRLRPDGDAILWVDGILAALERKGLYLAHSDNLPPFLRPSVEPVRAAPQIHSNEGGRRSTWRVWASLTVISILLGGLAVKAPSIIEKFKARDFSFSELGIDSYPNLEEFPKIEMASPGAHQYPTAMRDWCSGDEVFCASISTGNLTEALRV